MKNSKKYGLDYLREQKGYLLYLLIYVFLLFVWWLCDLPWQPMAYLFLLLTVFASIQLLYGLQGYIRRRELLEMYTRQAAEGVFAAEEEKEGLEGDWYGLVKAWHEEYERQKEQNQEEKEQSGKYYTLWSHQIKTPIAAMNLLLQEEEPDLKSLKQELWKAEQYVDMALQYQRLDRSGRDLVLKEYPLETLVKKAVKNMASVFIYNKTGIQIEAMPGNVLTDEKWFLFVLEQVLGNAVKYTAGRENGKTRIYSGRTDKGETVIVEDNGIGIRREDIPRVFEWGYTGYNGRREKRSTGIGLFLCRQVMDMLGQSIEIESEEGKGTRVILGVSRKKFDME